MGRITVTRSGASVCVAIGSARRPTDWGAAAAVLVLGGAFTAAAVHFWTIVLAERSGLEPVAFLVPWTVGIAIVMGIAAKQLSWRLFGREQIRLTGDAVVITEMLFGRSGSRSVPVPAIRSIMVDERVVVSKGHSFVNRSVVFDCDGAAVRLRSQLSEYEARAVVESLSIGD